MVFESDPGPGLCTANQNLSPDLRARAWPNPALNGSKSLLRPILKALVEQDESLVQGIHTLIDGQVDNWALCSVAETISMPLGGD